MAKDDSKAASRRVNDTLSNYWVRLLVGFIAVTIHWSLFGSTPPALVASFAAFQVLIYPHLLYWTPALRRRPRQNLDYDNLIFGLCVGLWGFNLQLMAIVFACAAIINSASGGSPMLARGAIIMVVGSLMGGWLMGFNYRSHLPVTAQLAVSLGLVAFMVANGLRLHQINARVRRVRNELEHQTQELKQISELALAVNANLDVDAIVRKTLHALEQRYDFESMYILILNRKRNTLKVSGIYGQGITSEQINAFEAFEFDCEKDGDSVFVRALKEPRVVHTPNIDPQRMQQAPRIDQKLFAIKPGVSMAYFPVYVKSEVVAGACFINYQHKFRLAQHDIKRIENYLIQVGTAIKNAALLKQMERAKQAAETSERAKSRFLANMSHEIRTPITSIVGYAELLVEEKLGEQERHNILQNIVANSRHLLAMISDILDIAKIDANKISVVRAECDLVPIFHEVQSYLALQCRNKNLQCNTNIVYPVPKTLVTDCTRLKQILLNLCHNAAKFTDNGTVTLQVTFNADLEQLTFAVQDTGIGIQPEDLERIFRAFDQADTSITRPHEGTGLGLHIAQNLAKLLGGELEVSSIPGQGSTFCLHLPATSSLGELVSAEEESVEQPTEAAVEASYSLPRLHGTVLLAEDNTDNQKLISRLLTKTGLKVDTVSNGLQALEAAAKKPYDIVILDMQMPGLGGEETASRLITNGFTTPIIAFTANVMKHQIEAYQAKGIKCVVEKPIDRRQLYDCLRQWVRPRKATGEPRILIAEDDQVNQIILRRQILAQSPAAKIDSVYDGLQAVTKVKEEKFDLIFMDLKMPLLGGAEATKQIRELGCIAPLYIVSGNDDSETIAKCFAVGANGHMTKPVNKSALSEVLNTTLVNPTGDLESHCAN